jgi:hypothetical protein
VRPASYICNPNAGGASRSALLRLRKQVDDWSQHNEQCRAIKAEIDKAWEGAAALIKRATDAFGKGKVDPYFAPDSKLIKGMVHYATTPVQLIDLCEKHGLDNFGVWCEVKRFSLFVGE